MIIKNSQQDVNIEEPIHVKKVSLKISGGADSAIVGYMLSKYVAEERPDIKIFPLTTNHPKKPYQGVYASRIINFYKEILCRVFQNLLYLYYIVNYLYMFYLL